MYNLKITEFPSGITRVQIFDYEVRENFKMPLRPVVFEENPFDDQLVKVVEDFPDYQRSLYESMRRTKNMVYDYSLSNKWDWFVTLTFSPEKVDRYNYDSCVKSLGSFFHMLRRKCPGVKYLFVPEQHKDGAFHFHGLISACDGIEFISAGIRQNGKEVYNIPGYRLGFSTATRVGDSFKAGNYISKYITKDLCQVSRGRKRYWNSRNLQTPAKQTMAVDFGGRSKRELMLTTLYDQASYYKETVSPDGERTSWFYEFPSDCDLDFSQFEAFRYDGG